jgi:UDP-glucose 4-epimerase
MKIGKKKIILVTGGAGFIGSRLIERLVKDGKNRVISLDNYFTGKKENHIKGAEYRKGHTKDIKRHVPEKPDIIYHLGEYSRVAESIKEPEKIFDLNMAGTAGVVEFWREKKCKLVYAGSSTKFSKTRPDGIEGRGLSPYAWSKAANSELVRNYGEWYGLPYAISYFYNVFGPREPAGKYGTVVAIFMSQYLNGEPLTVRLPGTQTRNYTHVDDTVDGLLLIGEKGRGDEYGIGSQKSYSTMGVARLFKTEIVMLPARKTSRPSASVNTEKIKKLGWREKRPLKEYIDEFLNKNGKIKTRNNA